MNAMQRTVWCLFILCDYTLTGAFVQYHTTSLVGSILLLSTFTVSHTTMPTRSTDRGWVRNAHEYTTNICDHWFTNWWMGLLNFQIEHHLFPTMPQCHHPTTVKTRVIAFAKQHSLPYRNIGFLTANLEVVQNLRHVALYAKAKAKAKSVS
jgi:fatty acid desaturase 2 (delta-6 desaturase)